MNYREFRELANKGESENYLLDKYIFRYISVPGSYLFSKTGISPNIVTLLSLVCSLTAVGFFIGGSRTSLLIACALVFLYHYLDHVDGELARFYFLTRGRQAGIAGSYFDVLCHSFSVNLWLPAIAFGLYRETGYVWIIGVGIAAMAAMSNFPKLVATHMFAIQLVKDPRLLDRPEGVVALESISSRHKQIESVVSGVWSRAGLVKLSKEIVGYPGMIFLSVMAVVGDVFLGTVVLRLVILCFLTAIHGSNSIRNARSVMAAFISVR